MKRIFLLFFSLIILTNLNSQINAKLMKYMDVSADQITFVFGGDIWIMPKAGGLAVQLTNSLGEESWPRFSPDGKSIGFTASYNGNSDVYTILTSGGIPHRVTYQSFSDRMLDWHPDGKRILFRSGRESGRQSFGQFYLVDKKGGLPSKLQVPYGELASYSPDGNNLAYITKITENYPFKRYRGGLTSDILIYDLVNDKVENITNNTANDGKPAWVGDKVFFLSDQDRNMRLNIWVYDTNSKKSSQVTKYKDFDISFMSSGPSEIVYEAGGELYIMDHTSLKSKVVDVKVISDLSSEMPRKKNVSNRINNAVSSPDGKRVIFEARGELFNAPVKDGYTTNLTNSSGAFDRNPSWAPNGKNIAFWSDRSGEFEIYIKEANGKTKAKKLTNRRKGFGYNLHWSPDSKLLAYIDETNTIFITDVESGEETKVDHTLWNEGHGGRFGFSFNWSKDSKWLTYSRGLENHNNAIFLYNVEEKKLNQATSGFYNDAEPCFDPKGNYLFYTTNRNMSIAYSSMGDGTWIYPNSTQIAAMSLRKDVTYLMQPENDEVKIIIEDEKKDSDGKDEETDKEKGDEDQEKESSDEGNKSSDKKDDSLVIEFDNIESRVEILSLDPGVIRGLSALDGKVFYIRYPNTGAPRGPSSLMMFDLKEKEEKSVLSGARSYDLTADGKSILVSASGKFGIIKPAPGQKLKDAIPTSGLEMDWVPKEEWRQLFSDAWRRHRDFFYDPNMHKLDWDDLRERYGALIEDARTRWDVNTVISSLCAELSAGHTYTFGGDSERSPSSQTGFLGIDWDLEEDKYKIKRIVKPAEWDTEVRSPFDRSGMTVKEGDYILSVNGKMLDQNKDPYAAFEGLSGKVVSLMVETPDTTKEVVIKCLSQFQEVQLRYLEWIENNRKMVDKLSGGKLGYVYMSNTGGRGHLELVSMFYGQLDKKGFVIDERFNGGGSLADRFLELLKRPVVYNLHWRHGKDQMHPTKTNIGPMGMLINGWAGSGGDGLPWAFQELKAGPIVGERTLGILVGPATGHSLIDGGGITVPGARLYDNDGHWFWEGVGVTPDIEVWDDPNILIQGRDPQIERVVDEVLKLLETQPGNMTPAPPLEDRTAKGLRAKG